MPPTTPAEPVTDPEQARQLAAGQRALRRSMVMSIILDVLIAIALVFMGLPIALVLPGAALIIGLSVFGLSRVIRAEQARLAHFRNPVTGRIEIPGG